jgi:primosomal protein N' (replication factor Y)
MAHRREHKYPPFQRLVRIIVRSQKDDEANKFADHVAQSLDAARKTLTLQPNQVNDIRLLGPAEAPLFRLKGYYRYHLQLQSVSPGLLHQLLRSVLPTLRVPGGVEHTIDVDPLNML